MSAPPSPGPPAMLRQAAGQMRSASTSSRESAACAEGVPRATQAGAAQAAASERSGSRDSKAPVAASQRGGAEAPVASQRGGSARAARAPPAPSPACAPQRGRPPAR